MHLKFEYSAVVLSFVSDEVSHLKDEVGKVLSGEEGELLLSYNLKFFSPKVSSSSLLRLVNDADDNMEVSFFQNENGLVLALPRDSWEYFLSYFSDEGVPPEIACLGVEKLKFSPYFILEKI